MSDQRLAPQGVVVDHSRAQWVPLAGVRPQWVRDRQIRLAERVWV